MLYIVLTLVLAALGLVVTALVTAHSFWAWISIGLSCLAGLLLVAHWWGRRSAGTAVDTGQSGPEPEGAGEAGDPAAVENGGAAPRDQEPLTARLPASGEFADGQDQDDPPEEQTAAADLPVVSALEAEVLVVDERPRYHLAECRWLTNWGTIPLAVREARELGFTPCAACGPDAGIVAEHRGKRPSRK